MSKISKTKTDVLDQFESRKDDWTFGDFEFALKNAMGVRYENYQTAKSTITDAFHDGRWPNTVKRYVLSNCKSFGNSSLIIAKNIFAELTEEERAYWVPVKKN